MKILSLILSACFLSFNSTSQNQLFVPSIINSTNINLTLQESTNNFYPNITTNTIGANGNLLGPTLILLKDSTYHFSVNNQLTDTTTIHWHGLHVSPENDGGPHTYIVPNTTWNPEFQILDKAGTFWYHPHLHMKTDKHVSLGLAGLILVRDQEEAALGLPLTYGIDEFPLILQTKGFDGNGQILVHTEVDSVVMVNGTIDANVDFPAQVVRLRVLNGSSQRVMEFGFSDNRTFQLIGTDGGLLNSPVALNRYRIAPGQRADILVDFTNDFGQNLQIMSYGSELPNAIYGSSQPGMAPFMSIPDYDLNPLNGNDYELLNINIIAQTSNPVTTIPSTLANYSPLQESSANTSRSLTFTSESGGPNIVGPFLINNQSMDINVINYTIPLGNTEIWTLTNQTPIAHPFHIHDVQFFILDINGNPPPAELQGLNDVVLVPAGQGTVRFIARFDDFANENVPYMYHCHMLTHEDAGMMGQFIVSDLSSLEEDNQSLIKIFPNPSNTGQFNISLNNGDLANQYEIYDLSGKLIKIEKINDLNKFEINLDKNIKGIFSIHIQSNNKTIIKKIILI